MGRPRIDLSKRLEDGCIKTDSCWLWQGSLRNKIGYGQIRLNKNNYYVHRVAYEHWVGEIPKGKILMHSCDVRNCINPAHLKIGTQKENMLDASIKGRLQKKK